MTGHHVELLSYLPALDRDPLRLHANRVGAVDQRIKFLFQSPYGLDGAVHVDGHGNHRARDHDERDRNDCGDDYQPKQRVVRVHVGKLILYFDLSWSSSSDLT